MVDNRSYYFTSESVSEGHPDKVCDQISDAVLDHFLAKDPQSRVAMETLVTTNRIILAGEVRSKDGVNNKDLEDVARQVCKDIGYEQDGFHWQKADVQIYVHEQSADIAQGVDSGGNKDEGAGDQGMMFGYACTETDTLMPAPIHYSHLILKRLAEMRHADPKLGLEPDSKSQVTVLYENGQAKKVTSVVLSHQHHENLSQDQVSEIVRPVIRDILPSGWVDDETEFYVNPTGRFVVGGPDGDTGLTGRKIIVDTYGGMAPHGGGAFSGKDPTKVDRSAAYASRYLAKNVVAAGLADKCTIQLAYAIGVSQPLSVYVDMHGTGRVDHARLEDALRDLMDLSPRGIREHLSLTRPIYRPTASYGHFGRDETPDGHFSWEKTDLVGQLKGLL